MSAGPRVLVTGARGFLGAPLEALWRGRSRLFLARRTPGPGILAGDLCDPAHARAVVREARPDLVFHLAGTTKPEGLDALWREHVTMTDVLLSALASEGRPVRVVCAGSAAEYGAAGGARRPAEDAEAEPLSAYGTSKLAQGLCALSFSRGPVEVVAARVFNVLGPGTPDNLAPGAFAKQIALIEAGRQEPELRVGDLSPKRDYLDRRDVASALSALARRGRPGLAYNVGEGRSVTMRAILDGLLAASTGRARVVVDPSRLRPVQVKDMAADVSRLRRDAAWRPKIPLARSLADTLAWWRERTGA
ncbi:MAG: NAD-dependent epimerase/dehydratase family protein [Elusimicrobiota bacterium]|nr:MAG: NAD-dependent epimerase/dehydratase family protein [Elusimicrobiota bacterium]